MPDPRHDSPSRRDFLKTSTAAAVGAGVLSQLSMASRAYASSSETIRVGLIGCGGRGTGAARQALSTEGPVKLVAMADAFSDRLENSLKGITKALGENSDRVAVDDDHKFVGFDAYQRVIDSDVDLVILATPPGFRPFHFDAAVRAGKHVFMEKPVAIDAPGVRMVLDAVKESKEKNLKVGVGLQRHHQDSYLQTIKRIKDGAIGDVVSLRCYWNGGGVWDPRMSRGEAKSEMEYQMRNWYYYVWLCGDHIVEQHIHNLDVCNWIKDAYPVKCQGMGGREVRIDPKYGEIFDHFAVEYTYADGTPMFSQCRHIRNCWNSVSEHAHGSNGYADVSGATIHSGSETWRHRRRGKRRQDPYQVEHDDLFAAIRNNTPYNEGENGAYSTLTAIMGRMAVYSGQVIDWDKALKSERSLMPARFAWDAAPPTLPNDKGEYPIPVPGLTEVL